MLKDDSIIFIMNWKKTKYWSNNRIERKYKIEPWS